METRPVFLIFAAFWLTLLSSCSSSDTNDSDGNQQENTSSTTGGEPTPILKNSPPTDYCQMFPADNMWNTAVDTISVHPNSDTYIESIGPDIPLHPDFGTTWNNINIGISYDIVPQDHPRVPIRFTWWDESDFDSDECDINNDEAVGCYPIPSNYSIEGGGDNHLIILETGTCTLYEIYAAEYVNDEWTGGSGAIWHLDQNEIRPEGVTSADAAGLAILPGLIRYDEVYGESEINHALRITMNTIQSGYIRPASHSDGTAGNDPSRLPMGLRMRLKSSYVIPSDMDEGIKKILRTMKKYGVVVADTGGDMYVSGTHDSRWDDDILRQLRQVPTSAFEALDTGPIITY